MNLTQIWSWIICLRVRVRHPRNLNLTRIWSWIICLRVRVRHPINLNLTRIWNWIICPLLLDEPVNLCRSANEILVYITSRGVRISAASSTMDHRAEEWRGAGQNTSITSITNIEVTHQIGPIYSMETSADMVRSDPSIKSTWKYQYPVHSEMIIRAITTELKFEWLMKDSYMRLVVKVFNWQWRWHGIN